MSYDKEDLLEKLVAILEKRAEEVTIFDKDEDADIYDWFEDDVRDAYWRGCSDGEVDLARELLCIVKEYRG
jgi:hypothetical protein